MPYKGPGVPLSEYKSEEQKPVEQVGSSNSDSDSGYKGPGVPLIEYNLGNQPPDNELESKNGFIAHFKSGIGSGVTGDVVNIARGTKHEELIPDTFMEKVGGGLGYALGMIPEFAPGSMVGGAIGGALGTMIAPGIGTAVGAGIGSGALGFGGAKLAGNVSEEIMQEGIPEGQEEWKDFARKSGEGVLGEMGIGAAFGAGGLIGSKLATPLTKSAYTFIDDTGKALIEGTSKRVVDTAKYTAAQNARKEIGKLGGELVGMTETSMRMKGQAPTLEDYLVNAGVVGILHGASRLTQYSKVKIQEHQVGKIKKLADEMAQALDQKAETKTIKDIEARLIEAMKDNKVPIEKQDAIRKGISLWEMKDNANNKADLSNIISENEALRNSDKKTVKEPIKEEHPEVTRLINKAEGLSREDASLNSALIEAIREGEHKGKVIKGAEVEAIESPMFTEARERIANALGTDVRTFAHLFASDDFGTILGEAVGALSKGQILVAPEVKQWNRVEFKDLDVVSLGHEGAHLYLMLLGKNDPIVSKGLKEFGGSEEALVERIGQFYRKEMTDKDMLSKMGRWLKDLVARIKEKLGKADGDELARILLSDMIKGKVKRGATLDGQGLPISDLFRIRGERDPYTAIQMEGRIDRNFPINKAPTYSPKTGVDAKVFLKDLSKNPGKYQLTKNKAEYVRKAVLDSMGFLENGKITKENLDVIMASGDMRITTTDSPVSLSKVYNYGVPGAERAGKDVIVRLHPNESPGWKEMYWNTLDNSQYNMPLDIHLSNVGFRRSIEGGEGPILGDNVAGWFRVAPALENPNWLRVMEAQPNKHLVKGDPKKRPAILEAIRRKHKDRGWNNLILDAARRYAAENGYSHILLPRGITESLYERHIRPSIEPTKQRNKSITKFEYNGLEIPNDIINRADRVLSRNGATFSDAATAAKVASDFYNPVIVDPVIKRIIKLDGEDTIADIKPSGAFIPTDVGQQHLDWLTDDPAYVPALEITGSSGKKALIILEDLMVSNFEASLKATFGNKPKNKSDAIAMGYGIKIKPGKKAEVQRLLNDAKIDNLGQWYTRYKSQQIIKQYKKDYGVERLNHLNANEWDLYGKEMFASNLDTHEWSTVNEIEQIANLLDIVNNPRDAILKEKGRNEELYENIGHSDFKRRGIESEPIIDAYDNPWFKIPVSESRQVDLFRRAEINEKKAPTKAEKDRNFFQRAADRLDIENRFDREDAPGTGQALKGSASMVSAHIDKGINLIKKVGKINGNPQDQAIALMLAENPRLLKQIPVKEQARFKDMTTEIRKYFDEAKKELIEKGILKQGFVERKLTDLTVKVLNAKTDKSRGNYLRDIERALEMDYVPITYQLFLDQGGLKIGSLRKAYSILNRKQRNVFSLVDLLAVKDKNGNRVVDLSDFDFVDVIHRYSMKLGRDVAKADVINAAIKEGLVVDASDSSIKGFVVPKGMSAFKGKKVHPVLLEMIQDMSTKDKPRFIDAVITWGKMGAFINPFIMPMYDSLQGVMAGSFNPLRPFHMAKLARKAWKDMSTFSEDYQNASRNYLFSQPIEPPYLDIKRTMARYREGNMQGMVKAYLKEIQSPNLLKTIGMTARSVYEVSWAMTWTMDKFIRMMTYNHMIEKGSNPREAAQIAAKFHGDYASVPRETRRSLNKVFFTPTFKIVMGKLWWNMLKGFANTTGKIATGKYKEVTKVEQAYAWGLLRATAGLVVMDTIFKKLGFQSDQFSQRFSKDYEDEDGKRSELSLYFTNPINLPLKYSYRIWDAFTKNDGKNWMTHILRSNRWELNPLWRVLWEVAENRGRTGNPIYQVGEHRAIMALQGIHYMTTEIFRILQTLRVNDDVSMEKANKQLDKEIGVMASRFFRTFGWASKRSPKYESYLRQANSIKRAFMYETNREIKAFKEAGKPIDWERIDERRNRIIKQIDQLIEEASADETLSNQEVNR